MQREEVEAASFAGIELQARLEDRAQSWTTRDVSAVSFGVIEAGAPELEEVDDRGDQQNQEEIREVRCRWISTQDWDPLGGLLGGFFS